MKLNIVGPQAITLFTLAKESGIPTSAKATSYATPQAYFCADSSTLKIFIKGREFTFIDMEAVEKARSETGKLMIAQEADKNDVTMQDIDTMKGEISELHKCVSEIKDKLKVLDDTIYGPLHAAFHK